MLNLHLVTIRSLNHCIKRKHFLSHLHKSEADICFIQETHFKKEADVLLNTKKYQHPFHALGSSKARGVSILIKTGIDFKPLEIEKDHCGRFFVCEKDT